MGAMKEQRKHSIQSLVLFWREEAASKQKEIAQSSRGCDGTGSRMKDTTTASSRMGAWPPPPSKLAATFSEDELCSVETPLRDIVEEQHAEAVSEEEGIHNEVSVETIVSMVAACCDWIHGGKQNPMMLEYRHCCYLKKASRRIPKKPMSSHILTH